MTKIQAALTLLSGRGTPLLQAPHFASVELTPPPGMASVVAAPAASSSPATGLIEIVLPGGALVRVDAHVDGRALRPVQGALAER